MRFASLTIGAMILAGSVAFSEDKAWETGPTAQNPESCFDYIIPKPRVNTWISCRLLCIEERDGKEVELYRSDELTLHVENNDAMVVHVDARQGVGSISNGRARMTLILPDGLSLPAKRVSEWVGNRYVVYRGNNRFLAFVVENRNSKDGGPVEAALYSQPIRKPKKTEDAKEATPNKVSEPSVAPAPQVQH